MDEYISKHDAYTLLKDLEAAYIYPPVKEAYATAARRIDQMKAADVLPINQWISVKDRLPEDNRPVLCCVSDTTGEGRKYVIGSCEHSEFWFLKIGDNKRFSFPYMQIKVTHWMPLSELPKDGEQNENN